MNCLFVDSLQGRLLLAHSDSSSNRGWWSDVSNAEAFDRDENYVELKGAITASEVAFDTWFLWSEGQMVGVSDLGEDIPNIFEVPGGTPCIAGDSAIFGYGLLLWASQDGIYAMDQTGAIRRITEDQSAVFGKMGVQTHGGSRATLHNSMYEIQLAAPNGAPVSGQSRWRYDLLKPSWSISTIVPAPLATFPAPLGHADQGIPHPMYGNVNPSIADRNLYVGEYTTTDAGSGFACVADIHFGPPGFKKYSPMRAVAYYQTDAGWGAPIISAPPGAAYILGPVPATGTPIPKSGTDYKLAISNATQKIAGAQDIVIRFSATTTASGAVANQRLVAAYLDGDIVSQNPVS